MKESKVHIDEDILDKIIRQILTLSKDNISTEKYNKQEMIIKFQEIIEREVFKNEN